VQAEDGIRDFHVTGVQTCALPIFNDELVELMPPRLRSRCTCRCERGTSCARPTEGTLCRIRLGARSIAAGATASGVNLPTEGTGLLSGSRRGTGRPNERVLAKTYSSGKSVSGRPALIPPLSVVVVPHPVARARLKKLDALRPIDDLLQVGTPRESTYQLHSGLPGIQDLTKLGPDIYGIERLVNSREGFIHRGQPFQDCIRLVWLDRCLGCNIELDRLQPVTPRHVEQIDVVANRDPG